MSMGKFSEPLSLKGLDTKDEEEGTSQFEIYNDTSMKFILGTTKKGGAIQNC